MSLRPRRWQTECLDRFREKAKRGEPLFVLEACMGAGKSSMAALLAKDLLEEYSIDHVLVLVPWVSIRGDTDKGMLGAFGEMGIDVRDHFFSRASRRQVRQPRPDPKMATVALYQEVCCQQAIETLQMWMERGDFKFALICDEIHHTNEINSSWGTYVEQLEQLASYSIFMSGTYFRSDKLPLSCIPLDASNCPIKHFRFPYAQGVQENVVRSVTTRDIDAKVVMYDRQADQQYEVDLKQITNYKELAEAKKQVLDPSGEWIGHLIERVHADLMQVRSKFPDAACLFVCRPGGNDNYTQAGAEAQEDRHIAVIAGQIQRLTGCRTTVVTHKDQNSPGKIARFRNSKDPYLVAINMVSEGCDIPRLRAVAFCRYTNSEMLFRQIVGRALRLHTPEDGTAAQIYIPSFPVLLQFAERLYSEAQEGIRNRPRCPICGEWPCICPCVVCGRRPCICLCPICGQRPCVCPKIDRESDLIAIDAIPKLDGGHVGVDHVLEPYVEIATRITNSIPAHQHSNTVQLGHAFQQFEKMQKENPQPAVVVNPAAEREKLRRQINRLVKRLAFEVYGKDFKSAYHNEIYIPFGVSLTVILETWNVDRLQPVAQRLESRVIEAFRRG